METESDHNETIMRSSARESEGEAALNRRLRNYRTITRALVVATLYPIVLALITPYFYWRPLAHEPGEPLGHALTADYPVRVVNQEATRQRRESAALNAPKVFVYDSRVLDSALSRFQQLIEAAAQATTETVAAATLPAPVVELETGITTGALVARRSALALAPLRRKAQELGMPALSDDTLAVLVGGLARDDAFVQSVRALLEDLYLRRGVVRDKHRFQISADKGTMALEVVDRPPYGPLRPEWTLDVSVQVQDFIYRWDGYARQAPGVETAVRTRREIALTLAQTPNIREDLEKTRRRREAVLAAVEPVVDRFEPGQTLIAADQPIGDRERVILVAHQASMARRLVYQLVAHAFFIAMALWILIFHMRRFCATPDQEEGRKPFREVLLADNLWLTLLPIVMALAFQRVALFLMPAPADLYAGYLFPAGMVGILGLMLIGPRTALLMVVLAGLLLGLMMDLQGQYMVTAIAGGFVGVAGMHRLRERKQFLVSGVLIACVTMACIFAFEYLMGRRDALPGQAGDLAPLSMGLLNGLLCVPMAHYLPIFYERYFGVITDIRLLELTSRHHLLQRMEREAPGTYQHSLNVSKLAEAAVDAVGASFLLVRAGAYFHDIGKIAKHEYFTENQVTPDETRIHQKLKPNMSALLIKNHVKDGEKLARKHGLPQRVIDFIPMHHGTMLISYFLRKAVDQYNNSESQNPVDEDEFRYPGPKPKTRETAILMMADAIEATVHSKLSGRKDVDKDDITLEVLRAVDERVRDGQFDECPLTMQDLFKIKKSFVETLKARFHRRVAYDKKK